MSHIAFTTLFNQINHSGSTRRLQEKWQKTMNETHAHLIGLFHFLFSFRSRFGVALIGHMFWARCRFFGPRVCASFTLRSNCTITANGRIQIPSVLWASSSVLSNRIFTLLWCQVNAAYSHWYDLFGPSTVKVGLHLSVLRLSHKEAKTNHRRNVMSICFVENKWQVSII